jgi:hypothetical protein
MRRKEGITAPNSLFARDIDTKVKTKGGVGYVVKHVVLAKAHC